MKNVLGIGIYERGKHAAYTAEGAQTHLNSVWRGMLRRCGQFDPKRPQYAECILHDDFVRFQDFAEWATRQVGHDKHGYQLDKDLLVPGNKVYGPHTCIFVPREINVLLTNSRKARGKWPVGVTSVKTENNFRVACSVDGEQILLFGFTTPEAAFATYKVIKELNVKRVAEKFRREIDPRVYERLIAYEARITD